MIGYLLFIIPMAGAFLFIARRYGARQAILDLLAFNLVFAFGFASLLPGNLDITLVHLLLMAFFAVETLNFLHRPVLRVSTRLMLISCLTVIYIGWIVLAVFFNYRGTDQMSSSLNNAVRNFVFWALLMFVGVRLARTNGLYRFGKIFLWACVLVAVVSIIQTASSGQLLRNDEQSVAYLSIFQPLGDKLIERRILSDANVNISESVHVITMGPVAFYRAPGTFDGASIVLCSAAVAVFALLTYRRNSRKLLLLFLLLTFGFLAAFTRTSIIVFVVVIAFISLLRFRALLSPRLLLGFAAAILIALFAVLLVPFLNRAASALIDGFVGSRSFEVASLNGRLGLWQYVGDQIPQHPNLWLDRTNYVVASWMG